MSTLDYVRFVSGLSAPERSMLYNSGASEWVMMRTELEDALGKDGYRTVRSAFPILGSAGVKSISNKITTRRGIHGDGQGDEKL